MHKNHNYITGFLTAIPSMNNNSQLPSCPRNTHPDRFAGIPRLVPERRIKDRGRTGGWFLPPPTVTDTLRFGQRRILSGNRSGWLAPNSSSCEGLSSEAERKRFEDEPPCPVCKYTGMATCAGLSLYFLRLAVEDSATAASGKKIYTATKKSHKAFFYGGAIVWAATGIYRSVLDY